MLSICKSVFCKVRRKLSDDERVAIESIWRDLEIERSRSLTDAATGVIVGAMARAEPSSVLTRSRDRHTAEVGAYTKHDKPKKY